MKRLSGRNSKSAEEWANLRETEILNEIFNYFPSQIFRTHKKSAKLWLKTVFSSWLDVDFALGAEEFVVYRKQTRFVDANRCEFESVIIHFDGNGRWNGVRDSHYVPDYGTFPTGHVVYWKKYPKPETNQNPEIKNRKLQHNSETNPETAPVTRKDWLSLVTPMNAKGR